MVQKSLSRGCGLSGQYSDLGVWMCGLETEIVNVSFPGWHVISTVVRPHSDHCRMLPLVSLHSWDLTPLVFGVRSNFERGESGSLGSSKMTKAG